MTSFPLIYTTTANGIKLDGFLWGDGKDGVFIHIHGTSANFYYNQHLLEPICNVLDSFGLSLLSTNNSGSEIYNVWKDCPTLGAANETFEDCLADIDAWIEFVIEKGFKKIVLSGHSLGTEKVVYYMSKGKYREKVSGVVLFGFADSYGNQEKYTATRNNNFLAEAVEMIKLGDGEKLIQSDLYVHSGFLPKTAKSYVNFFSPKSELATALPLRNSGGLRRFQEITVPILALIGDTEEFTVIPIAEAVTLLKRENNNAEVHQIKNCDHEFTDNEGEVCGYLSNFLKKIH